MSLLSDWVWSAALSEAAVGLPGDVLGEVVDDVGCGAIVEVLGEDVSDARSPQTGAALSPHDTSEQFVIMSLFRSGRACTVSDIAPSSPGNFPRLDLSLASDLSCNVKG